MFIKKNCSVVLIGLLVLVCGGVANAQGRAGRMERLKSFLTLTDAQAADIRALIKKHRETAFPLRQEVRALNQELRNALDQAEPNPSAVGKIVVARRGLNKQLRSLNVRLRSDIAALLTPEQRQKLEQLKAWRAARGERISRMKANR